MRRVTAKDILKSHKIIISVMVLYVVCAMAVPVLLLCSNNNKTEYGELQQQTVVVRSLETEYYGKHSKRYYIITEDGEFFFIGGKCNESRLGFLTEGAVADVKYSEGSHRFSFTLKRVPVKFASEIYVGDYCVTEWFEQEPISTGRALLIGAAFALPVPLVVGLILMTQIRHVKKLQKRRDRKIHEKYGSENRNREV